MHVIEYSLDRVHFPLQMNVHTPAKLDQKDDQLMLLSIDTFVPDHFFQLNHNNSQLHTMKSPDPNINRPTCERYKTILN